MLYTIVGADRKNHHYKEAAKPTGSLLISGAENDANFKCEFAEF